MKRYLFYSTLTFLVLAFISSAAVTVTAGMKPMVSTDPDQQEEELYDEDFAASATKSLGVSPLATAFYKVRVVRRGDKVKSRASTKTDVIVDLLKVKNILCRNGVCSRWMKRKAFNGYIVKAGWNTISPSAANWLTKSRHKVVHQGYVYTKRLKAGKYM